MMTTTEAFAAAAATDDYRKGMDPETKALFAAAADAKTGKELVAIFDRIIDRMTPDELKSLRAIAERMDLSNQNETTNEVTR